MAKLVYLIIAAGLFAATGVAGVVALCGILAFIYGLDFLAKLTSKPAEYEDTDDEIVFLTGDKLHGSELTDELSAPSNAVRFSDIPGNRYN